MKTVIYTGRVDNPHHDLEIYSAENAEQWSAVTAKSVKNYSKNIGADYKTIKSREIINCLPAGYKTAKWWKGTFISFEAINTFANSNYDIMLYLDIDVYVYSDAKSIFNEYTTLSMLPYRGSSPWINEAICEQDVNIQNVFDYIITNDNTFFNTGVVVCDKDTAQSLVQHIHDAIKLMHTKPINKKTDTVVHDEHTLNYICNKEDININALDRIWNTSVPIMKNEKQVIAYKTKHNIPRYGSDVPLSARARVDKDIQMHHFIGENKQLIDWRFFK